VSGNIVPRKDKFKQVKALINTPEVLADIQARLPNHLTTEKMTRAFLTALTSTPQLLDCEPASLLKAVMEASQLGLVTDSVLGHGYILPYKGKAKFIPGYRGLIDLARRSGQVNWIQARVVYEGDDFEYEYGLEPFLTHKPATRSGEEAVPVVAVYAAAKLVTGEKVFEVMYRDDIEKIRRRSPAGGSGPWVTDWEEMARKTLIRRLMKYLPLSTDVQNAVMADEYAEAGKLDLLLQRDDPEEEIVDAESVETIEVFTESVEDDGEESASFEGKGRITKEEDERFAKAVNDLYRRAVDSSTSSLTEELFQKVMKTYSVDTFEDIRSRANREAFYRELLTEITEWEKLA